MPRPRVLVTGARGTLGTPLCERLEADGAEIVRWNRDEVDPLDLEASCAFVRRLRPDRIVHLAIASRPSGAEDESARINGQWPTELARTAWSIGAGFLLTSTAMVFSNDAVGPFTLAHAPDAPAGYGHEKRQAERAVMEAHPGAVVVRLGWQIGDGHDGNQMRAHLHREVAEHGRVRASTRWLPACSWLPDTITALLELGTREGGLYMLDANERWSFFEIACALRDDAGEPWEIVPTTDFVYDQRLLDPRMRVPSLAARLPALAAVPDPRSCAIERPVPNSAPRSRSSVG
jgi:dTDP-4-dehydrorhamnose reductase